MTKEAGKRSSFKSGKADDMRDELGVKPGDPLTRGQMAQIMCAGIRGTTRGCGQSAAIQLLKDRKLTTEVDDFRGGQKLTNSQLVVFTDRLIKDQQRRDRARERSCIGTFQGGICYQSVRTGQRPTTTTTIPPANLPPENTPLPDKCPDGWKGTPPTCYEQLFELVDDSKTVGEGDGSASFTVRLLREWETATTIYVSTERATADASDYGELDEHPVTIAAGDTEAPVAVSIRDDRITEREESFKVKFESKEPIAESHVGTVTITDDDAGYRFSCTVNPDRKIELSAAWTGQSVAMMSIRKLVAGRLVGSITYIEKNLSENVKTAAKRDLDGGTTVVETDLQSVTYFNATEDVEGNPFEGGDWFEIRLHSDPVQQPEFLSRRQCPFSIPTDLQVKISNAEVMEGGVLEFVVSHVGGDAIGYTPFSWSVDTSAEQHTAEAGDHEVIVDNTFGWRPGRHLSYYQGVNQAPETRKEKLEVRTYSDPDSDDEIVVVKLESSDPDVWIVSRSDYDGPVPNGEDDDESVQDCSERLKKIKKEADTAYGCILEPIVVSFDKASATISEGGSTDVTVTLEGFTHTSPLPIPLRVEHLDGASTSDHSGVPVPRNVTFAVGETSKTFTVTAVDDTDDDDGESIRLNFGSSLPTRVKLGTPSTVLITITDNDTSYPPFLS